MSSRVLAIAIALAGLLACGTGAPARAVSPADAHGEDKTRSAVDAAPHVEPERIEPRSEARTKCETGGNASDCASWSNEVFARLEGAVPSADRDYAAAASRSADESEASAVIAKLVAFCRAGALDACQHAEQDAPRFKRAFGRKPDVDVAWLEERACELGASEGCLTMARRLEAGGRPDEAFRLRDQTCASKGVGCGPLADLVEAGPSQAPANAADRAQYVADLRARACLSSSGDCTKYAALYRTGLRARGDFSAASTLVTTCEANTKSALGCTLAAAVSALGIGVPRDLARARRLYGHHCANPEVQSHLRGRTCEMPKEWQ